MKQGQPLSVLYVRYRTVSLLLTGGLLMVLSFLWYLPGAYHARDMDEYHRYAFREFRFNNVIPMYVNHRLDRYYGPDFILKGTGIEYPALLSVLIRATAGVGVTTPVPFESYRSGTPAPAATPPPGGNVPTYVILNYAVVFVFGLLAIYLIGRWRGSRPWLFVASPLLLVFAGYNWDLVPIALSLSGVMLLARSIKGRGHGRGYNLYMEIAGFVALTVGIWFKLFPVVFLVAVIVQRIRSRMWRSIALGAAVFVALSLLINLPLALGNFDSWYFFLWVHQNRDTELSIWYWLLGDMQPAVVARPDVTAAVNTLSLLVVGAGGLAIAALAWKSPRRDIVMPLGCVLLVWWLLFNKVYDPNFDIYLLFVLAVMAAPFWLYVATVLTSFIWYLPTFIGLYLTTQPNTGDINIWLSTHALFGVLIIRLALLCTIVVWLGRKLLTPDQPPDEQLTTHSASREPTSLVVALALPQ